MRFSPRKRRSSCIEPLECRAMLSAALTETASATISDVVSGSGTQYSISLTNTSATPATSTNQIGSFWFGWVPGVDYLTAAPTSITSPTGWTSTVVHLGAGDGYSIQWVASSSSDDLQAGNVLSGFSFIDSQAPTTALTSPTNVAFVYSGAIESDAGFQLTPTVASTPVTPNPPVTPAPPVTPTPPITPTPPVTVTPPTATETASASIVATQINDTTYQYAITVKNTTHGKASAANDVGTFWYAWLPDEDFLATTPLSVTSPKGWTEKTTNSGSADGFGLQWVATSNQIKAGKSLTGFTFTSTDTPAEVFGKSTFFPSTAVNTAVVYAGAPFSDTGFTLTAAASVSSRSGALLPQLVVAPLLTGTTVPANGDVNPYGVTFVPKGFPVGGATASGDVLVSNFNNSANLQGTGSTIVSVTPAGATSVFYQGPAGVGLTTALGVLRSGFVIVGNVPSTDGTSATAGQGSLIVLDKTGNQVAEFTDPALLDGPWDLAVSDSGATAKVFVSNVLSGTVTRLNLKDSAKTDTVSIVSQTQIASGYTHAGDPAAFELGPTGLVFSNNTLYVASTDDNAIYAIKAAGSTKVDGGKGLLIYQDSAHLRGPLGLALAPNGDLIAANGDAVNADPAHPSELVEFTTKGQFVTQTPVDSTGQGGAFGIAVSAVSGGEVQFAAVDDLTNTLDIWTIKTSALKKH